MTLHFRCLALVSLLCLSGSAYASERGDLYTIGREAYAEKKYVTALKNLYAFYVLNEDTLQEPEHQEFKNRLEVSIRQCEAILALLLKNANISPGGFSIEGQLPGAPAATNTDEPESTFGASGYQIELEGLLEQPDLEPGSLVIEDEIGNRLPGLPVRSVVR